MTSRKQTIPNDALKNARESPPTDNPVSGATGFDTVAPCIFGLFGLLVIGGIFFAIVRGIGARAGGPYYPSARRGMNPWGAGGIGDGWRWRKYRWRQ